MALFILAHRSFSSVELMKNWRKGCEEVDVSRCLRHLCRYRVVVGRDRAREYMLRVGDRMWLVGDR
jgi:hypothetical protein